MQLYRTIVILLVTTLANAQLPNIPACSLNCFVSAFQRDGCSQLMDFACHCQKPELVGTVTPCVQKACSLADQSAVSSEVVRQCSLAGHPISVPPVGGAAETTTLSMPKTSTVDTSVVSSSSGAVTLPTVSSSLAASPSRLLPSASATASTPHLPSSTSGRPSQSSVSSASPSTPLSTGSASNVKAGMAGVVIAAAAAAYIL
ncbi:CFEM-domain-containing protein [Aspergillus sclerotioniger CBS 115572]|uniref:CFEM-domain-containing protein n=1 Tax=Aspergillus sclerotioniger CBS 115572 TaxID=1450535 RepID=A0A317X461_9EURO|nr:CFEM-domain-containing protein [Aspergillus sclerotioniger CBS 115572]PWY91738.1 CFEM-domain-containing protein [Aspergillus sclerotioniger CBS 115572]